MAARRRGTAVSRSRRRRSRAHGHGVLCLPSLSLPLFSCPLSLLHCDENRDPSFPTKVPFPCLRSFLAEASPSPLVPIVQQRCQRQKTSRLLLHGISVGFPKPEVIEWQKDLSNSVSLIGTLGNNVVIKYLDSGKVMAHCIIKVKRSGISASKDDSV